jgi:serine/threonine protein kinase/tetratricopeptide (TPR) repeat protein
MIGKIISHYKILEKLGEGGMGVVYKAQDTKLDRIVALKFLPQHLTSDSVEKERFIHEAKAASALNHTNITTIHEIDEFGGQMFIVMEYCEGRTLKRIIEKETLSIRKVLDIGIQICEGLTIAHEKGIVHRDIKSDNIMLTPRGQVKIMDFGLAKLKGATKLTKTRSTLGTAAYMSPEQAQGEEVDQRSDIFSFGVVLYELLTGRLPFEGEHQAAIIYSIINEEPQPVARFNNQISAKLEDIVFKALAKDREERYQHIDDLLADLRRERKSLDYVKTGPLAQPVETQKPVKKKTLFLVVTGLAVLILIVGYFALFNKREPESGRKMLAVLPFENLGAPEQEYFAAGITDEITTHLAKVSGLGVISRTSVLQYKDTKKTVQQIGKELGVQYVLEGTILWDKSDVSNRIRINPQLIRVKDGIHVWAETYDRVLEQIFALQSDVAEKVASALDVTLLEPEKQSITGKPTDNLEAYEYYLRGKDYFNRSWAEKDFGIAIEMYEKAVELDQTFALAYANLSQAHSRMYWYYYDRTDERLNKAKEAVDRALELKPDLPEAHLALGFYYYHGRRDYDRALEQFAIAQKDQPNNSDLLAAIGYVQRRQGKFEQAVTNLKKAAELDPRSNKMAAELAFTYEVIRKYPEAEYYFDRAISLAPDWPVAYSGKAWLYIYSEGNTKKARKVLQEAIGKADVSQLVPDLVGLDILDGDYQTALGRLPGLAAFIDGSNDTISYFSTKAVIYGLLNQPELKVAYFDSARIILENKVQLRPGEALFHSRLGIVYAGLGRREEAIREGKKAVELLPVSKDAFEYGLLYVTNLAQIYVMVGDYDSATDQLEYLLSIPSYISIPYLRIDPTWAPLRNHPRFQKLLARNK